MLLPLYYLADATVTLIRRLLRGERVWQAHRTHFYQRATDNGHSVHAVVTGVLLVNIALVGLAILTVVTQSWTMTDRGAWRPGCLLVGAVSRLAQPRRKMTRVLVTGASGFVGRPLTRALAQSGHVVWAAAREPQAVPTQTNINPIALPDLANPAPWNSLLAGMDVVIHLAGIAHAGGDIPDATYDQINRARPQSLAQAAAAERRQAFHLPVVDPRANRPDRRRAAERKRSAASRPTPMAARSSQPKRRFGNPACRSPSCGRW